MRRKDREMPWEFAEQVADKCEWAVLSLVEADGSPYCVPISIVREDGAVYFHTSKQGRKIDALRANPKVCMACVGDTKRAVHEFTTEFESAVLRGIAEEVTEEEEKLHVMRLLCEHHVPTHMDAFEEEVARSIPQTGVWKIRIQELTGKRKKIGKDGKELKFGEMEE